MALLIDGYNLLHVTGIDGLSKRAHQHGAKGFQRSREALLRFLAASIDPAEIARTTIVFDAADAPPGLPKKVNHEGMTVRYAAEYADADTLIEELIEKEAAPKSLLVVSSDHRIQRAARRRKSPFVDSDRWYAELWQRRHDRRRASDTLPEKPTGKLSAAEVDYWLQEFSSDST